jgi:1-aminocyclopropane-1-carboxylate deaminase/D-cysteine desulfhydrase-like pyridoxal-dependent ACC family enzyme
MSVMSDLHLQIHELYNAGYTAEHIARSLDVTTDWVYEALALTMFVDMLSEDDND